MGNHRQETGQEVTLALWESVARAVVKATGSPGPGAPPASVAPRSEPPRPPQVASGCYTPLLDLPATAGRLDAFELEAEQEAAQETAFRGLTLRPYQGPAIDATIRGFWQDGHARQIGIAATGSGKTAMFCEIARRVRDERGGKTLILTDQLDLVEQTVGALARFTGILADSEQGENVASRLAPAVVAMVQTLVSRLDAWKPDHFMLVVVDECDRALSPTWQKVIDHFAAGGAKILGVTATPKRTDKRCVLRAFGNVKAFEIPLLQLIKEGWLAEIVPKTVKLPIDMREVKKKAGDFDPDSVAHAIEMVFDGVVEAIKQHAQGRRIIVFLPLVTTSKKFRDACIRGGLRAEHIDGSMTPGERRVIKQGFRDRRFDILCNPCLLGRGYDDAGIDCVINLRATMSQSLYFQIVGRGTRLYCPHGCPGKCRHPDAKKNLLLLDFLWQVDGHGLMRPANIIAKNDEEAQAISEFYAGRGDKELPLELIEGARQAKAAAEKSLLERFLSGRSMYKVPIKANVWAAKIGEPDWVNWEPETDDQDTPITQQQATELQEKGFQLEHVRGGYHAAFILGKVKQQRAAGLATYKQAWWLWQRGHTEAHLWDRRTASNKLDQIFQNNN